ncbi:MAG TPA: ATP-binding cassette domain-containing protein, partial [Thermomicrobiaceae bacterium]|nr:ATP-binding cassette domain-containing protein [Thermomicrobiaceae bacterium]
MRATRTGSITMLIARLDRIGLSYGTRQVLDDVSLSIDEHEKIGLVGPNGAGKSSLFKVLAGIDQPQAGERTLRRGAKVAYLAQEYAGGGAATVLEEVVSGNTTLAALEAEIEAAQRRMGDPEILDDPDRFDRLLRHHGELLEAFDKAGGSGLEGEARGILRQLDIPEEHFDSPLDLLSGGQLKLVGLARCLIAKPDILLLDEPDNHLDLAGKARLEAIIRDFEGAVVIISHDRYLLDDTVGKIAELEQGRLTEYDGNYSSYAVQRELKLMKQQQDWVSQQKEIQRLEEAIARFKLWASLVVDERHIKQARNKQRQLDQMEKVERPVLERRKIA